MTPLDIAKAQAQRAHDLGLVCYRPTLDVAFDPSKPLVCFGELPAEPILAVAVNVYDVAAELDDDRIQLDNPLISVQWRFRAPGDDAGQAVHDRAHAFFEAMHTDTPGRWPGGVAPIWCLRTVTAPAELDNGHWSKADSYEIRCNQGDKTP